MTSSGCWVGGGDMSSKITAEDLWVRSDVIRIVFSLLISSFLGGSIGPPAVRKKVARTP